MHHTFIDTLRMMEMCLRNMLVCMDLTPSGNVEHCKTFDLHKILMRTQIFVNASRGQEQEVYWNKYRSGPQIFMNMLKFEQDVSRILQSGHHTFAQTLKDQRGPPYNSGAGPPYLCKNITRKTEREMS